MQRINQWRFGVGLLVLLLGLIACSDETGDVERLSQYASDAGILGTYGDHQYERVHVGYVYDEQQDALLVRLQAEGEEEAYVLSSASQSLKALLPHNEATHENLRELTAGEGRLLKELQTSLEAELLTVLPEIEARALPKEVSQLLLLLGCRGASKFIDILMCLFEKALASSAIGTSSGSGLPTSTSGGTSGTSEGTSGSTLGGTSGSTSGTADTAIGTSSTGGASSGDAGGGSTDGDTSGGGGSLPNPSKTASIRGMVWFDKNLDAAQNLTAEPGLEGFTVYLDANNNEVLDRGEISTLTDTNGEFLFTNLTPNARYIVRQILPLGWTNHHGASGPQPQLRATPRIMNGTPTTVAEHPYLMFLRTSKGICAATLIAPSVALTASHCLGDEPIRLSRLSLRIQSNHAERGGKRLSVTGYRLHPEYKKANFNNDFALLGLDTPMDNVPRVFLPEENAEALEQVEQVTFSAGWGSITPDRENVNYIFDYPQKAQMRIVSHEDCRQAFFEVEPYFWEPLNWEFPKNVICVKDDRQASCLGDAGGPLYVVKHLKNNDIRHIQIGVHSFLTDFGCNHPVTPDGTARIAAAMPFIKKYVRPEPSKAIGVIATLGEQQIHFANFH